MQIPNIFEKTEDFELFCRSFAYRNHGQWLKLSTNINELEDVLQSTLTEFWRTRHRYQRRASLKTYLVRIAYHLQNDQRKRKKAEERYIQRSIEYSNNDEPINHLLSLESSSIVRASLSKLSFVQRQAIELVYMQGLSFIDASIIAGCSVDALKGRCKHAKIRLKHLLRNWVAR